MLKHCLFFGIFFFLIGTFRLEAQYIERNIQPGVVSEAEAILPMSNERWLVGGTDGNVAARHRPYLEMVDTSGVIWGSIFGNTSHVMSRVTDMEWMNDSIIGLTIKNYRTGGTHPWGYFFKFLVKENLLEQIGVHYDIQGFLNGELDRFDFLPDGKRVLLSNTIENGQRAGIRVLHPWDLTAFDTVLENSKGMDVITLEDETFLVAGSIYHNGEFGVLKFSSDGDVLFKGLGNKIVQQIISVDGERVLAITKHHVYELGESLNVLQSAGFPDIQLVGVSKSNDAYFLLSVHDNGTSSVMELDTSLNIVHTFSFGNEYVVPKKIAFNDEVVAITGNVESAYSFKGAAATSSIFLKTFSREGLSISENIDVEIGGVRLLRPIAEKICQENDFYNIRADAVLVNLVNKGEVPIHELVLLTLTV